MFLKVMVEGAVRDGGLAEKEQGYSGAGGDRWSYKGEGNNVGGLQDLVTHRQRLCVLLLQRLGVLLLGIWDLVWEMGVRTPEMKMLVDDYAGEGSRRSKSVSQTTWIKAVSGDEPMALMMEVTPTIWD
ncbi:hypothetical protein L6452_18007 [Arctium lappa]|uniref:Uncharacterized protein n=1 Tax=Arctium lappa TaxID=4217 RepID=A0ACB9C4Z5_ARCLA|nr:hypothetical protein L6452_18007 [Arctium lappa]